MSQLLTSQNPQLIFQLKPCGKFITVICFFMKWDAHPLIKQCRIPAIAKIIRLIKLKTLIVVAN